MSLSTPQLIFTTILVVVVGALSEDAFYECSELERTFVVSDDGLSLEQSIPPGLPFYGGRYKSYYVGTNGIVQFARPPSIEKTIIGTFPDTCYTFIAPFYGDLDGSANSFVNFCIVNNTDNKLDFSNYTNITLPLSIVATWSEIGYNSDKFPANTFQCVIQTDGEKTFAIFLYKKLQWIARNPVHVGFNNGTNGAFWEMPCSGTKYIVSLVNTSNVGVDGLWVFRVDGETIEPACTNKETCSRDEVCSCLQECRGQKCRCKEAINTCSEEEMEDDCNLTSTPAPTPAPTLVPTPTPVVMVEELDKEKKCQNNDVAIGVPLGISITINIALIGLLLYIHGRRLVLNLKNIIAAFKNLFK